MGTYNVILTVSGSGGTSSVTRQITVQNPQVPQPNATFTTNPTTGDAPLIVEFAVADTSNITNYAWTFGAVGSSSEASPTFTFSDAGTYNVQLVVTGAGGQASSTMQIVVNQLALAPVISIDAQPTSGERPLAVQFEVTSSGGVIDSYSWDFGDGTYSNDPSPTHIYATAGSYDVKRTGVLLSGVIKSVVCSAPHILTTASGFPLKDKKLPISKAPKSGAVCVKGNVILE